MTTARRASIALRRPTRAQPSASQPGDGGRDVMAKIKEGAGGFRTVTAPDWLTRFTQLPGDLRIAPRNLSGFVREAPEA